MYSRALTRARRLACRSWCHAGGAVQPRQRGCALAITIDPNTAALTVTSDPLPTILDGMPLELRTANVTIDRPTSSSTRRTAAAAHRRRRSSGARARDERLLAVRGLRLRGPDVRPEVHGLDIGQNLAENRGEPRREGRVPDLRGCAVEHRQGQGRTPQAAALEVDDTAEGVSGGDVNANPASFPARRQSGSRRRPRRCCLYRWRARCTSSLTAGKRSPTSSSSSRATASGST